MIFVVVVVVVAKRIVEEVMKACSNNVTVYENYTMPIIRRETY